MSRVTGILWCLVDFFIQVGLTIKGWAIDFIWWIMFRLAGWIDDERVEEQLDDSEKFYHDK